MKRDNSSSLELSDPLLVLELLLLAITVDRGDCFSLPLSWLYVI